MPGKKHMSEATRARIIADVISGNYVEFHDLAARYQVSKSTITRIKNNIDPDLILRNETERLEIETARRGLEQERRSIPHRVTELLAASLEAATRIAEQVNNSEWLNKQSAEELATFYDSLTGTAIRIIRAIEEANMRREERAKLVGSTATQPQTKGDMNNGSGSNHRANDEG